MDQIHIYGGTPLEGSITISGSKNAALPLMAASLLTDEPLILKNIPHLSDITTMANLLLQHGVSLEIDGSVANEKTSGRILTMQADNITNLSAPYDLVRKMRASIMVLGPLLARFGEACVSLPGGCAIGTRPVNLHLEALETLGATIDLKDGYIHTSVKNRLKGGEIVFSQVSVGATENLLMAAVLAEGRTVMRNAAREPEVTDLARCLVGMGAKIDGIGTDCLTIDGVERLNGTTHTVLPDRIETGSYAVAAAITDGEIDLINTNDNGSRAVFDALEHIGVGFEYGDNRIRAYRKTPLKSLDITTQPHPGFPTDMQAQCMVLLSLADGASVIKETIFENRYMHVSELMRMGADISLQGNTAIVRGVPSLSSAEVMATDLRASMCLVLAALAAEGKSTLNRVYHIDRGYEHIVEKLSRCNARIRRVSA